ncbi:MAG: KUP/HAK/KT family potassium transporter [Rhodoferax sp.]|nr:KUP/HAK/KT family potassium transporter [Rhodoferax sp.]
MHPVPTPTSSPPPASVGGRPPRQSLPLLTLGALGVVYGDIGTSPLYTVREVFAPATGVALNAANIVGAVSVIFWALMLVVTLKYVLLILRADNHGEGGALALAALAASSVATRPRLRQALLLLGMAGATLFYGDSIITPAISVLGAMEGLQVLTPSLAPLVVPGTVLILLGLFLVQRLGTSRVGQLFGPVIGAWFLMLAVTGGIQIARHPEILAALNPLHAWQFLTERGWKVLAAVGAIVLALTGAEALYADMGHFGRRPIQWAWTGFVLPALALNYLGQGALLMAEPQALENPFFHLFSGAWLVPALLLSTLAAIIASQAVISGAYSMTQQAMQLGFLPRMQVRYTSAREIGQIYMPAVNWVLLVAVIVAVLAFGSSSALAGAYGIAVTLTMLITTLLTFVVVRQGWRLPLAVALGATALFLLVDLLLVLACAVKLPDGGWFPLALGALLFLLMHTWWRGRQRLLERLGEDGLRLQPFVDALAADPVHRVARTAVYAVANPDTVPQALLHNLKHNQVLHTSNVIVTVLFREQPWVAPADRLVVQDLGHGFWRVTLTYGFMEVPDVPRALLGTAPHGLHVPPFETSYFLSRENIVPDATAGSGRWRQYLFAAMSRNASGVASFLRLPDNAVVELGTQVPL